MQVFADLGRDLVSHTWKGTLVILTFNIQSNKATTARETWVKLVSSGEIASVWVGHLSLRARNEQVAAAEEEEAGVCQVGLSVTSH